MSPEEYKTLSECPKENINTITCDAYYISNDNTVILYILSKNNYYDSDKEEVFETKAYFISDTKIFSDNYTGLSSNYIKSNYKKILIQQETKPRNRLDLILT